MAAPGRNEGAAPAPKRPDLAAERMPAKKAAGSIGLHLAQGPLEDGLRDFAARRRDRRPNVTGARGDVHGSPRGSLP